jgi:hypothetical protein
MFVNGVPFLVSASCGLNLLTAEHTPSCTAKNLAAGITHIMDLYARAGFQVGTVLMDNEFECLKNLVPTIVINTTAANEHVPEIERQIRLIKERGRGILNTLPYKKMPQLMLFELIYHVVLWLNAFPMKSGVSKTLSPREIVYRHKLDYKKHCQALFRSYVKAHKEPHPTNGMITRGSPAIILGPTGNQQGTYKLMNLATGKKIKCREWTNYPMPDSVIKRIETLVGRAVPKAFDFADRNGILFEWNDEVDENQERLVKEEIVRYPSLVREFPGVALDRDIPIASIEDEYELQGRAEDKAARNANHAPYAAEGVDGPIIINADGDEIEQNYDDDNNEGIIAANDIPRRYYNNDGAPPIALDSDHSADGFAPENNANDDDEDSDDEVSVGKNDYEVDVDDGESIHDDNMNDDAQTDTEDDSIPGLR